MAAVYEVGSGGWPLCVPKAFVAFRSVGRAAEKGTGTAGGDVQAPLVTAIMVKNSDLFDVQFHRISLEADYEEVTLLICSPNSPEATSLPSWLKSKRVVVPHTKVLCARHWTQADVTSSWPPHLQLNAGSLYHHWVELTCTPRDAPDPMSLLLALPNSDIARRLHEVYSATPRPPRPEPAKDVKRAAITCELQMLAKVDLSKDGQAQNCAVSMRRSITESTGIQRNRVQVLSVREGGGSLMGWAAVQWSGLQKAFQPDLNLPRQLDV